MKTFLDIAEIFLGFVSAIAVAWVIGYFLQSKKDRKRYFKWETVKYTFKDGIRGAIVLVIMSLIVHLILSLFKRDDDK